jgi:hypothetical protein
LDRVRVGFFQELKVADSGRKYRAPQGQAPFLMSLRTNFGLKFSQGLWAAAFVLALALPAGALQCPADMGHEVNLASAANAVLGQVEVSDHVEITQYVMDSDGDHSLDLATVVEHPTGGYAQYTVQLHLASGVDQSIVVAAPPGGLQLEMQDMTGDKVPNDLVLRPSLLRWLPTVLLNDGHDHFAIAISATDPISISCGQELASRGNDGRGTVALLSSGFKTDRLVNDEGQFHPQVQEEFLSPAAQTNATSLCNTSCSGRAPPAFVINS